MRDTQGDDGALLRPTGTAAGAAAAGGAAAGGAAAGGAAAGGAAAGGAAAGGAATVGSMLSVSFSSRGSGVPPPPFTDMLALAPSSRWCLVN